MATLIQRKHMVELHNYLVRHERQIHYQQYRPMDITSYSEQHMEALLDGGYGIWADCSEMVTAICKWAGLQDPCGNRYNGWGNTNDMFHNPMMAHYFDPKNAMAGALVIFGDYPNTHHVAQVHTADPKNGNPLLFSHGVEAGPLFIKFHTEDAYHTGATTFLAITKL